MSQQLINLGSVANDGTGSPLRTGGQDINANFTELYGWSGQFFTPTKYGVDTTGATDCTTAMQTMLNAATAAGAAIVLTPGSYLCGLLTDTSGGRLKIISVPGAVIKPTGATWLKVLPGAQAKFGIDLSGLAFSLAHCADGVPVIWVEGSSSGGVVDINIHDIDFGDCTGQNGDLLWLRASFNGAVGRLWCQHGDGMRGVVYAARNVNSGNIRFYDFTLNDIAVSLQIGQAYNATTNQNLLNQVLCQNLKFVRSGEQLGMYNPVTLTAGASAGDATLTVSSGDATAVANALAAGTPQFAVCADPTFFGDVVRVTSASGTTIHLAAAVPCAIANGTIVYIGTAGAVVGANVRGVRFDTPHCESVGVGVVCSLAQQVQLINALAPGTQTYPSRLLYATNGTQGVETRFPIYSLGATQLTLHEIVNQGSVTDIDLIQPAAFASGSGPAAFVSQTGTVTLSHGIRFLRKANGGATQTPTYGASITPDESYDSCNIVVTDTNPFTINIPVNRWVGRRVLLDIYNNSGGVMGTVSFGSVGGAYKFVSAFTAPVNGSHYIYEFLDGNQIGNIREIARATTVN